MLHPRLEHARESVERRLGEAEVDHRVEAVAARPVGRLVILGQHVKLDGAQRRVRHRDELAEPAHAAARRQHLDDLVVGQHDATVGDAHALLAEQDFRGAGAERIALPFQNVAQNRVDELVDEERRHRPGTPGDDRHIGALERAFAHQEVAKAQQDPVVLGGVGVRQAGKRRQPWRAL